MKVAPVLPVSLSYLSKSAVRVVCLSHFSSGLVYARLLRDLGAGGGGGGGLHVSRDQTAVNAARSQSSL